MLPCRDVVMVDEQHLRIRVNSTRYALQDALQKAAKRCILSDGQHWATLGGKGLNRAVEYE